MLTLPVTYSVTCSNALLLDVIPQFQIDKVLHCEFWCQGLNDTYKVKTEVDTFILRIYRHGWRDLASINFEIQALLHLQKNGADIAYPIATKQGHYIVTLNAPEGLRYAILTRYISGNELDFSIANNAALYAQHLAQIHLCSEQLKTSKQRFQLDVKHLISEPLARIKPFLMHRQDDWLFIKNTADKLTITLQNALEESLDIGFCHADMHGGNAHYDGKSLASFDFDCCAIGLRVYDLAVFKWSLKSQKKEEVIWQQFLDTYLQHRPLADADLTLIDSLVSIRHLWLIGLHIDIAVAKGWLDDNYFDQKIAFLREAQIFEYKD